MSVDHRRSLSTLFSLLALLAAASASRAQDQAAPEVENAKYSFAGIVNSGSVYIRSGAGENNYPTMKLDKGAAVTVVGIKFDWLKIIPPDGSYSYVAKAFIEKHGDGTTGIVTKPDLNVRAGSSLNAMKTGVQCQIPDKTEVQIIGEQDEYFKIKPPKEAYLWVNKQFVDPVKPLPPAGADKPADIAAAPVPGTPTSTSPAAAATTAPSEGAAAADATTTQPAEAAAGATSQPASAEAQFEKLETDFLAASKQPLDEQPVKELLTGYQDASKSDQLPESLKRIADYRISTLKVRADAKDKLLEARKMQDEILKRQQALKAEQQELQDRIKQSDVQVYTAIGTLRTSSLQNGPQVMYRLTDPNSGRTVVYIRTSDPKYASLVGQFIGVRGDVTEDTQTNMKIITPREQEQVDPAKVGQGVAAQITPPTLLPKTSAAAPSEPSSKDERPPTAPPKTEAGTAAQ